MQKNQKKRITQSQFSQFFFIGMVYFELLQVNPHIQAVQNMYGIGGLRVFQAELRAGEVYPIFQKNNN